MEKVTSTDGTQIAYRRSGEGPPLVLVHGTTANHSRWSPALPAFEQSFTVYAMDRRGYGESGDAEDYAIEREFEDIASLVDSIGEPVNLLGHSYGALCSLGAALLTRNVSKLVLYEPAIDVAGEGLYPPAIVERMEARLGAGDRDGVVVTMLRELVGASSEEVEHLRSQPAWRELINGAHTVPRETRAEESYWFDPERFAHFGSPTLLLLGGDSPVFFREVEEAVNEALPDSRIAVMPGQGHLAIVTATELFTSEVLRFLTEDTPHPAQQLRFATADLATGVTLHYAEQGDPDGEAVIFLHGYSDSWFSFSRVLPLLSGEYHAFALTERGHGDSGKPECCYALDDFAADVDAFMDAVGVESATIVGHSNGSIMAPRVALSYPHRVSRLVLVGAATIATTAEANNAGVQGLMEEVGALEDPVPEEFVREFQASCVYHPVPEEFFETVISESLKFPARLWRAVAEGVIFSGGPVERLRGIGAPTLILWGEHDAFFPREEQEQLAEAIPGATLKVYSETGHTPHWEWPEHFVRDLETFVQRTPPAWPSAAEGVVG